MSKNGPLDFEATIDAKMFNSMLDEMERRIKGVSGTVVKEGAEMDKTFRNIGAGMAAYFSAAQLGDFVTHVANVRGEFQQLEISFETMLKNKALSDKLMSDVVEFAAKTPFDLQQVATGAKQLLAYGTEVQNIIPTMRQLGDVAAGLSIPFGDLVYLYGTSATQGKLMTKDLMQFAGRGIPIIEELSKILKVSKAEVMNLTESGKIGFTELQQVIENLTSSTGMFGGMMEKQAASINGLRSNLGDAWDQMLNDIGKANEDTIEDTIKTAISIVENYQRVIDILKVVVATYGAYRAAIILNTVAMNGYSTALNLATIRQTALNIAQKASPWGLALTAITALIGGLWAYNRATIESKRALFESNASILKQVAATDKLIDTLKTGNLSEKERLKVLDELKKVNPDVTDEIEKEGNALQSVIEKYEQYNLITRSKASIDTFKAQNDFDEVTSNLDKAESKLENFRVQFEVLWVNVLENFRNAMQQNAESVPKLVKEIFKSIEDESLNSEQAIARILKKREEIFNNRRTYGPTSKAEDDYFDYFGDVNQMVNTYKYSTAIRDVRNATTEYEISVKTLDKFIDDLVGTYKNLNEQQREDMKLKLKLQNIPNYQTTQGNNTTSASKEITVLERIKTIRDEILQQEKQLQGLKSPGSIYDPTKITETESAIAKLRKELDQLSGKPAKTESLKDQISEIQKMYENYYRWVERYGKESADKQFANLVKGGQSYLEYLERQIKTLESKPVRTTQDVNNLSTYLGAKDDLTGAKTRIQLFEEEVDSAKEKYTDLVDYINYLKSSLLAVGAFDGSELSFEKIRILYERLSQAEKEFAKESLNTYQKAIENAADFSKKRILIEQEYTAEVKKLDQETLGEERYTEALAALQKIRDEKLNLVNSDEIKAGDAYKKIAEELDKIGRVEAQRYLSLLEQQLEKLDKQTDAYKTIHGLIEQTKDVLKSGVVEDLNKASNELRSMADFASLFDEELGSIINNVSQIAGGLAAIASRNYFSGIMQIMTGVFTTIINASENAARKAEEYRERVLERLSERLSDINTLLERQIALIDNLSGTDKIKAYTDSFEDLRREIVSVLNQINELEVSRKGYRGVTNLDLDSLIKTYQELYGNGRDVLINELDRDIIERLISENEQAINQLYEKILNGNIAGDRAEELKLLIEQLEANRESFEDLKEQYNEYITGTTSDAIMESIISGFEEGKFAAEDFADTFEELMKNAMLQAVKMKYLEGPLKEWYETFASYSENGLTPEEIAALREAYNTIITSAATEAQNIQNITGTVAGMEDTLTGQVKGVTEETAGLIAGQMNAIRINQAHALALMDEQLAYQMEIAENTRHNRKLNQLDLLPQILNELRKGSSSASASRRASGE